MLALGYVLLASAGALFCAMTAIWLISIAIMNPTIVDVWWSLGQALAMTGYLLASQRELWCEILSIMFLVWAVRLTLFLLFTRVMKSHVDERYAKMESNWEKEKSSIYGKRFLAFQFQTVMQLLLLVPLMISTYNLEGAQLEGNIAAYIFAILCGVSVLGQWHADYQVHSFAQEQIAIRKENPDHPKLICKTGLWSYSRHPNYFFEMLIWISYAGYILSITIPIYKYTDFWSVLKLICPVIPVIIMFLIFRYLTGPLTEGGSLKKRPVLYKEYIENVPMIFPFIKWPNFISNMKVPEGM